MAVPALVCAKDAVIHWSIWNFSILPGHPSGHMNILKQVYLNSLYISPVKWLNTPPKEKNILQIVNLKNRQVNFLDFAWCWAAIELQKPIYVAFD